MIDSQPEAGMRESTDAQGGSAEKSGKAADDKAAEKALKALEKQADARDDAEKMLIRWIKVSLTLVTTGAATNRAIEYVEGSGVGRLDPYSVLRTVTAALVVVGIATVWVACTQHWRTLRRIERGIPAPAPRFTLALVVGIAVAVLAVVALLAIVTVRSSGGTL